MNTTRSNLNIGEGAGGAGAGIDGRRMVELLCQVHLQGTSTRPPKFTFNSGIYTNQIDEGKLLSMLRESAVSNGENINRFAMYCFEKFLKENERIPYGSVHVCPEKWTQIAVGTIYLATQHSKATGTNRSIVFANGCCTKRDCPINKFYTIIAGELIR